MQTKTSSTVLTPSQRQVLDYIRERCELSGMPPSFRDIQAHFGYRAVGTVQDHVKALVKKGFLERPKSRRLARSLMPRDFQPATAKRVPVYGQVAAGSPREAEQLEIGTLVIENLAHSSSPSRPRISKPQTFGLKVKGESMIEAGILEDDTLIVEPGVPVRSGDIVVALIDGESTVKRYLVVEQEVFLVPENRSMKPIKVTGPLQIQGKVVGLQRKY